MLLANADRLVTNLISVDFRYLCQSCFLYLWYIHSAMFCHFCPSSIPSYPWSFGHAYNFGHKCKIKQLIPKIHLPSLLLHPYNLFCFNRKVFALSASKNNQFTFPRRRRICHLASFDTSISIFRIFSRIRTLS